jgi:hypothetical protein
MKRTLQLLKHLGQLSALLLLVVPVSAHAYIDPGTGSTAIQVVIASLAAAGYFVKVFWRQIKAFVLGLFGKKPDGKN